MKRSILFCIIFVFSFFATVSGISTAIYTTSDSIRFQTDSITDTILNYGKSYMGTPYRYGSTGPRLFDCSGFTSYIFRHFGYNLNRDSRQQAEQTPFISKEELKKGDLVFFEGRRQNGIIGHVGIVCEVKENGDFDFLHASINQGVTISSSSLPYYNVRFVKGGRVINNSEIPFYNNVMLFTEKKTSKTIPSNENNCDLQNNNIHIVKKGENLNTISELYDLPIATIKQLNGLNSNRIKKGMKLKLSNETLALSADPNNNTTNKVNNNEDYANKIYIPVEPKKTTQNHTVVKGETLFSIAKENNMTIDQLKEINQLNTDKLALGQILIVNENEYIENQDSNTVKHTSSNETLIAQLRDVAKGKKPNNSTSNNPEESVEYTKPIKHKVKRGETISEIAEKYDITVKELKKINKLKSEKIKPGQVLTIKESVRKTIKVQTKKEIVKKDTTNQEIKQQRGKNVGEIKQVDKPKLTNELTNTNTNNDPVTPVFHTVKKGETISAIAKKYNITESELKKTNNLKSEKITPGQKIHLKRSEFIGILLTAKNSPASKDTIIRHIDVHVNNRSVEKIKKTNLNKTQLNKDSLHTSNINPVSNKHKVIKGETLYDISKKYNTSVEKIKQANNLSSDNLHLGQILIVSKVNDKRTTEKKKIIIHTVKSGESLFSIWRKYGCKLDLLKKWNNLNDDNLQIGQQLTIYP